MKKVNLLVAYGLKNFFIFFNPARETSLNTWGFTWSGICTVFKIQNVFLKSGRFYMRQTNAANPSPVPKGILLIIGGKEDKGQDFKNGDESTSPPEILDAFLKLIEKDNPVIEVVSTASSEGEESFEDYRKAFEKLNVTQVGHIHHKARKEVLKDELGDRV